MTVYIVRWTPRASSYPYLQVFATEELAEASKWYGDDDPRNYSKYIEKQEVIGLTTENMDNFDLKKYLAEGRLHEEVEKVNEMFQTYSEMFKHFYDKAIDQGMTPEEAKKYAEENISLFTQKMDEDKLNKKLPIRPLRELDTETVIDPLPKEWFSKYYTVDFYMDGPRYFVNKTGEQVDYMDIVNHYEEETGEDIFGI
jgi:hypothetical protein